VTLAIAHLHSMDIAHRDLKVTYMTIIEFSRIVMILLLVNNIMGIGIMHVFIYRHLPSKSWAAVLCERVIPLPDNISSVYFKIGKHLLLERLENKLS
jgi:serine/threonine protein kinase